MWVSEQIQLRDYESYIRDARDYALLHGLVLRYDSMTNDNCVAHIPFTLFPSPFPKRIYKQCLELQPVVNKLMLNIANNIEFMNNVLTPIADVDEFTANLLEINNTIQREGAAQSVICCINRSDYMLDKSSDNSCTKLEARQVEVNAIASSMSAHSRNTKLLQEFCMSKYNITSPEDTSYPQNNSLELIAQGLIEAYDAYGRSASQILLVAEPRSANFSDQILIEIAVSKLRPDIRFVRRSFVRLPSLVMLGPNKELLLEDNLEIAVVYFRYGYDPSNYNFEGAWATRLLLERSRAIKCPSINFHLSGAKKFQQVLNRQEDLERFLGASEAESLSRVFCKFWSIESDQEEGYKLAMSSRPDKLVLKPQREGGGHNIFGRDITPFVQRLADSKQRSQYILMEYIDGPKENNWLVLHDDDKKQDSTRLGVADQLISELGIFGSIIADGQQVISSKGAGYLVRSKRFGVNEGGVATGYAGISNIIEINDHDYSTYFVTNARESTLL